MFFWFENSDKKIYLCYVVMGCVCVLCVVCVFSRVFFLNRCQVCCRKGVVSRIVVCSSSFFVFLCFSDFFVLSKFSRECTFMQKIARLRHSRKEKVSVNTPGERYRLLEYQFHASVAQSLGFETLTYALAAAAAVAWTFSEI